MKIALLGYGKMGQQIEKIANERGHQIVLKINEDNLQDLTPANISEADVAIEFSTPHTVLQNVQFCLNNNTPIIIGTTGWYDELENVKKQCAEANGAVFYATNFSIGVNLFFALNEKLASLMQSHTEYEVEVEEIHHTQKLDSPSGTAITIVEGIFANYPQKKQWENHVQITDEKGKASGNDKLMITSIRKDAVPGTHTVTYQSAVDKIDITHTAFSRKGFAQGAVLAAEWIIDKKGIFTMNDLLKF